MAHLVFKPLRIVEATYSAAAATADPVEKIGEEHLITSHFFTTDGEGNEACDTFLLSDLVLGESVLAGYTTRGCFELGVVTGYKEGWYFSFDGSNECGKLWNGLLLVKGPLADAARARYTREDEEGVAPPLKRTDSGANYCHPGYPDLEFWTRSGVEPWLYVMAPSYQGWDETPEELRGRIHEMECDLRESEYTPIQRKALEYQVAVLKAHLPQTARAATPPRSATPPPKAPERLVPPRAPRKPSDTFCPVAQDNTHTYGSEYTVGQSWHGRVRAKTCSICDHTWVIDH
jgi:hypothetical protein